MAVFSKNISVTKKIERPQLFRFWRRSIWCNTLGVQNWMFGSLEAVKGAKNYNSVTDDKLLLCSIFQIHLFFIGKITKRNNPWKRLIQENTVIVLFHMFSNEKQVFLKNRTQILTHIIQGRSTFHPLLGAGSPIRTHPWVLALLILVRLDNTCWYLELLFLWMVIWAKRFWVPVWLCDHETDPIANTAS